MKNQKKTTEKQNELIAQSNSLVEGRYNYSLWELRIFIEMVQKIDRRDKEFKPIILYYKDLMRDYNSKSNRDYDRIKTASIKLMRKVVRIEYQTSEGEKRIYHSPLIQGISTPKIMDDGFDKYIELEFPEKIKTLLLDLKKNFLLYDKRNILKLKSKFSIRIYQLLKKHERKDQKTTIAEYEVLELREMLLVDDEGNPTNQYSNYTTFKSRVIIKAQIELQEYTDIAFTFEEIKKGRSVHSIKFYISLNRKNKKTEPPKEIPIEIPVPNKGKAVPDQIDKNSDLQKLIDVGVTESTAKKIVKEYDSQLISYTIKKAQQQNAKKKLTNLAGFIVKSLKSGDMKIELERKEKEMTKKRKSSEKKKQQKITHNEIEIMYRNFEDENREVAYSMFKKLPKNAKKEIFERVRKKYILVGERTSEKVIEAKHSFSLEIEIVLYLTEKKKLPKEQSDFPKWVEKNYQKKIRRNDDIWEEISK